MAALGGTVMVWTVAARAQQSGRVYRLAGVHPAESTSFLDERRAARYWQPLFDELRLQGFVEGQNLTVERHFGNGEADRYADLARNVAASQPDAIFCLTNRMTAFMKAATTTIPIIAIASDPVAFGLVPSLAHPGGNLTGVTPDAGIAFYAKHLDLLREAAPGTSRIAYLTPRAVWESPVQLVPVRESAKRLGVLLLPALLDAPIREPEYRRAFAEMALSRADGLIVGDSAENHVYGRLIVELVALRRLPAIYPERNFAVSGGLMSYGIDYPDLNRQAGSIIARILKGAKPADIPFSKAERFELVVNLKAAKALGLTISSSLLARADEVIE